jgi:dimethylamine/trimethylamine dehydrogenase
MEQRRVHRRLRECGVRLHPFSVVSGASEGRVTIDDVVTGDSTMIPADALVLVTSRTPHQEVAADLFARRDAWDDHGLTSVRIIGDADAPGTIAHAVWDGRRFAEELEGPNDAALFRRDPATIAT